MTTCVEAITDLPRRARRLAFAAVALLAGAAGACSSDGTGPDDGGVVTGELQFVRPDPTAPSLVATTASFWAVKGDNREIRLFYHARLGEQDSTEFLRFEVPQEALDRRPDGSLIVEGDSVLITVSVIDLANLIVDFQPSGLRFRADEPARLKFKFAETDDDLDEDGDVDAEDQLHETELAIWKRESVGDPWVRLSSNLEVELDQIEADILGFTNYAIAYRR